MKRAILLIPTIALILLACDKNGSNSKSDLSISKVEYSGCFSSEGNLLKSASGQAGDSLYYEINNAVLTLHVNLVYNCCGSLKDSAVIQNDIISIYIRDNCLVNCTCKCICLFKFNYSVVGSFHKNTNFRVYLKSYQDKNYSLWKEVNIL